MKREIDITQTIKAAGLKVTPQRKIIYEIMMELEHAPMDLIIEKVHEHNPDITVSTIYRILDSFCETGVLSSINNPTDGKHYFDITARNHHHLFDGQGITDYDDPKLTQMVHSYLKDKLPFDTNIDRIQIQVIINKKKSE